MKLDRPVEERPALKSTLEAFGPWSNRLGETWLVESHFSARSLRDKVKAQLTPGERVFVGEFNGNWAGWGMGPTFPEWMKRRSSLRQS